MARVEWLDILRGLGILFIVLGHIVGAGCHLSQGFTQEFCEGAYKYFYAFHVPLFFVVAGMTFNRQPWKDFFKKRFFRLLVPYFIFGVMAATIYSLTTSVSTELLTASDTTGYYQGKTAGITFGQQLLNLILGGGGGGILLALWEMVSCGFSRHSSRWKSWRNLSCVLCVALMDRHGICDASR